MTGKAKAKDQAPEGLVIPLSRPIVANGEALDRLVLGDPEIGCLSGVQLVIEMFGSEDDRRAKIHIDMGDIVKIIAGMADIPPSSARRLRIRDALACRKAIQDFLEGFL